MLELEVLILELLAIDGLATGAVSTGEVTTLNHELENGAGVCQDTTVTRLRRELNSRWG